MRRSRRALIAALAFAPFVASVPIARAQDPRVSLPAAAARDWLALLDNGDFGAGHAKAGDRFRTSIDATTWGAAYRKERVNRGALVSRTMVHSAFQDQLASAPTGEYATIVFRTSFANQRDSNETVTLEREKDGVWRVIGYLIR